MKKTVNQKINQIVNQRTRSRAKSVSKTRLSIEVLFYKRIFNATLTSTFFVMLFTIAYIGIYTNILSLNNKIYTKKMEIAKLEEATQKIINEIEMKTNYRAIEKVALASGMEYNDNVSYIK